MGRSFKQPQRVPPEAYRLLYKISKAALWDMVSGLALLGTNETPEEVTARICREAVNALESRGDHVPIGVREVAGRHIDSDSEKEE